MQNARPERVEPTEDGQRLRIVWRDGHVSEYEPRAIRVACPCAGCVDELTGRPILDPAAVPAGIMPVAIEYVGRYALKFTWPDGHDTGIYPYDLLRRLCPCEDCSARRAGVDRPGRGPESSGAITFDSMRRDDDDGAG
ncbi:MAG: DUF971 domain-containing protein [Gemmatimonadota bacterium]